MRAPVGLDQVRRAVCGPDGPGSSDYELAPDLRRALPPGRRLRPAAVLVPIFERPGGLTVLLTRRAAALKHHPGQIAFPGGKVDTADETPWAAALREAEEEVAVPPVAVERLGSLEVHETVTQFLVQPFVGLVDPAVRPVASEAEVAEAFEVPLGFVLDPANLQLHSRIWGGRERQYYAIPYGPYYIWGATARMLKTLSDRVRASR